jgi:hypothetical protein
MKRTLELARIRVGPFKVAAAETVSFGSWARDNALKGVSGRP